MLNTNGNFIANSIYRDRNKLTFYFIAEKRIDFRELVRELFRIYKTRIWMCAVDRSRRRIDLREEPNVNSCNESDLQEYDS
jgi:cell fate regulator YaaT (PSP1 superfamily)